ncbi:succinate dehydrogenase cytochrome b subunit [Saccharopolyspora sp. 5N708]|uniref:succinate dehydrogenase cytochrome b subunit n=1 Tax=Saccharopolyspora sp. 5N708 TaxID=3457424 RepID=UPI003FD33D86
MSITRDRPGGAVTAGSSPGIPRRTSSSRIFWDSSIGKKIVMAASGFAMLAYLVAHMVGNLKIFFGPEDFNGYAAWLRTIGQPVLHHGWFLWIMRCALFIALIAHLTAAVQLSKRDLRARPARYRHRQRLRASYATRTMRWGGVIVGMYLVWHILDLTVGVANRDFREGDPYHNVVADFQVWWVDVIYIVAVLMVGLHINHGFHSALRTIGVATAARERVLAFAGSALAFVLTAGFLSIPISVMTGWVG